MVALTRRGSIYDPMGLPSCVPFKGMHPSPLTRIKSGAGSLRERELLTGIRACLHTYTYPCKPLTGEGAGWLRFGLADRLDLPVEEVGFLGAPAVVGWEDGGHRDALDVAVEHVLNGGAPLLVVGSLTVGVQRG